MPNRADQCRFLIVSMATALMAGCGGEQTETEEIIRPVRFQQVYSTGGRRVRTFSGTARAGVESRLSFKVPGTVRRVAVKVGDSVQAGQLIAELDPEDYRLEVQRAQAALAQARAQERNAEAEFNRARELYENASISLSEYDAARAAFESARESVNAYERSLELARLQLSYARLTAPLAGAVAAVDVEVNENVQQGQAVVFLTSGSLLEVEVGIPEVLITHISEGSDVSVGFDALPGRTFPAVVTEVGVAALGTSTTFPVTVSLEDSDPDIRSGMAAEVAFLFESEDQRERYLAPPQAVGEDREGRFVFIVEPTEPGLGVIRRRAVEVGELTAAGLEVFGGLSDGDRLVTAGWSKIEDGMVVRLTESGTGGS